MPALLLQYLILAWVILSVGAVGLAVCHRLFSLRGIDLLGYGVAVGVSLHAIFGLLIALLRPWRHALVILLLLCFLGALFYLWRQRGLFNRASRTAFGLWLSFLVVCVAIPSVEVSWPADLPDGRYVFKNHRTPVKIQYLSTLPCDNYLPYVVTEYLVGNISFTKERPILPGQEVSNRTILMSLVAVPFRTALNWKNAAAKKLGRFNYVGKQWPNTERLNDDGSFDQFLPIGIFLNSLLLLGLLVFFSNLEPLRSLVPAALLFATSPYCLLQTIFTWPKALAGFFLLLAWNSIRRNHHATAIGLCATLAYHSHPAAGAALVSLALWYGWRALCDRKRWRPALEFGAAVLLALLPWFIWTRLILKIPADLVAQNFSGAGTAAAMASPLNFIWVRAWNIFTTLTPSFFTIYPFRLEAVLDQIVICLPTAVGLVVVGFAISECVRLARREAVFIWFGLIIPLAMIFLVFSFPATPLVHGGQVTIGALIFLGALRMREALSGKIFGALFTAQLLCNLGFIVLRFALVGAHW